MILHKKKKEKYGKSGIYVCEEKELTKSQPLCVCLLKGILLFLAVYGSLHIFLDGFSIEYAKGFVVIFFFLLSMIISMFYYNNLTKNLGYILFFILFLVGIFFFHKYINSGYSVLYNEVYDILDEKYNFSAVRHLVEPMSDRYTSATLAIIFYGGFVFLVVNLLLAEKMSLIGTIFCTFPFWQMSLYFNRNYNILDFMLVLFSYLAIGLIKAGGRYQYRSKKKKIFIKEKKKETRISYLGKGNILLQTIGVYAGIIVLIAGLFLFIFPKSLFTTPENSIKAKEKMDLYIQDFMLTGFISRLNQYDSRGGVSGGKLGGVGAVRPSYETDLEVSFVPLEYEDVYLKAYTGAIYTGSSWDALWYYSKDKDYNELKNYGKNGKLANSEYMAREEKDSITSRMEISIVNASKEYNYYPYYSNCLNGGDLDFSYNIDQVIRKNSLEKYQISYHPIGDKLIPLPKSKEVSAYEEYVWENYLTVTEDCKGAVSEFCRQAGVTGNSEEDIEKVIRYLHEQCSYSMTPGKTPRNQDFITYFLMEKHKGFCVHFASSAVMLFREMGIPARYIEGYNMSTNKIVDGVLLEEEETKDWVSGNISKGELDKLGVISVEVSDAQAHAWVEIYLSGYGWIPIEVTPAGFGEEEEESSFWNLFQKYFGYTSEEESDTALGEQIQAGLTKAGSILRVVLVIGTGAVLVVLIIFWKKKRKITEKGQTWELSELEKKYVKFTKKLVKKKKLSYIQRTYQDYQKLTEEFALMEKKENQYLHQLMGKVSYGGYVPKEEEQEKAMEILKKAFHKLKKE
ncbi:MAG: hypothetical protein HDT30_12960 [Clostridiales bacterium]|nr:hypothetical protein [Clostridiales bacterium]